MDDLNLMAAQAAVEKMFKDGYISICSADKVLALLQIVPDKPAYNILSTLHCVNFRDMPQPLQERIPELLKQVFGGIEVRAPQIIVEQKKRLFGLLH
jgi:hypothetical protein